MATRRGTGPTVRVAIPTALQPFFSVSSELVPLHGKKGTKKHRGRAPGLHANGRGFHRGKDPWHGRGAPTGH